MIHERKDSNFFESYNFIGFQECCIQSFVIEMNRIEVKEGFALQQSQN